MGKNPYGENANRDVDFFENEELDKINVENVESDEKKSKNPYVNGKYETQKQEESNGSGNAGNPYRLNKKDTDKTEEPPTKKGKNWSKVVLCVALGVVLFISGALSTWFLLGEDTRSFLKVKFLIENFYYEEIDEDDFYDVVFDSVNGMLDDYSWYMSPDDYETTQIQSTGARSGLGLSFPKKAEGKEAFRILQVAGNSPAEACGIKVGSYVVGYGVAQGVLTQTTTFDAFLEFLENFDAEEEFFLQILNDGQTQVYAISKKSFVENYVFYRTNEKAYGFGGERATNLTENDNLLVGLQADTAYIRLTQFNGAASTQFDKAMQVFKTENKKHLVLDLRGNGGGDMDILCDIAKYFCKESTAKKPLVTKGIYRHYTEKYYAPKNVYDEYFKVDSKIYVLADNGTASASEALMGCMLDYKATEYANICLSNRDGEAKTFGKGIMQMTIPLLFGDDALKITVAKIVWPKSNICIHGKGIVVADGTKSVETHGDDDKEILAAMQKFTSDSGTVI